jgi:hypothetical protein
LDPTHGGAKYFSKKQEYSEKDDSSLPVSLAEFETLPVDRHVDGRRYREFQIPSPSLLIRRSLPLLYMQT